MPIDLALDESHLVAYSHHVTLSKIVLLSAALLLAACSGPRRVETLPIASPTPVSERTRLPTWPIATEAPPARVTPQATRLPTLNEPLIWLLRAEEQPDLALVNAELNLLLEAQDFNARVELHLVEPGRYAESLEQMLVSNRPPDLISTGGARYEAGFAAGQFAALTSYLRAADPLWAGLPDPVWEGARRGGEIYAVPAQELWAHPYGLAIRADVVSALDLQPELSGLRSFDDLAPLLSRLQAAVQDGELQDNPRVANGSRARYVLGQADLLHPEAAGFDSLAAHFAVQPGDPSLPVVDWFATPDFRRLASLLVEWRLAGFTPPEMLDPNALLAACQSGDFIALAGRLGGPQTARCRYAWVEVPLSPLLIDTTSASAHLTALNASLRQDVERVRRALLLLEIVRSDSATANLLTFGIEGRHWRWTGSDRSTITILPGSRYKPGIEAQAGGSFLAHPLDLEQNGSLAPQVDASLARAWNDLAAPSPALGFAFDPRPVAAEISALRGLTPELLLPLQTGKSRDIDAAIQRLANGLAAAGTEVVAAELRAQLFTWGGSR